jgi:hypothetical protein
LKIGRSHTFVFLETINMLHMVVPYWSRLEESGDNLHLMEDAMMAYRVVRSSERRVFYIDVGAIAPQDVEQYMQKVVTQMKRNQVVDPRHWTC